MLWDADARAAPALLAEFRARMAQLLHEVPVLAVSALPPRHQWLCGARVRVAQLLHDVPGLALATVGVRARMAQLLHGVPCSVRSSGAAVSSPAKVCQLNCLMDGLWCLQAWQGGQ